MPASSPKYPYSPPPSASVSIAQADWIWAWADAMERRVAIAAFSLAEMRALMSLGIAIDAMIAMMATTIISSISVKPEFFLVFIYILVWFAGLPPMSGGSGQFSETH